MDDIQRKQNNENLISGIYETFKPMVIDFLEASEKEFKPRILYGYRSIQEQNEIYAQGRTKPGKIVTNAKGGQSFHNFGLAIDIYPEIGGYNANFNRLGEIAKLFGIEHGDRGYIDLPHFQYRGGLSLQDVQQGKRPPFLDKYNNQLTKEQMEELKKIIADLKTNLQQQINKIQNDIKKLYNRVSIRKDENIKQEKEIKNLKK